MIGYQECLNGVATRTSCADACLAADESEPARCVATSPVSPDPVAATLRTLARPAAFDLAISKVPSRAGVEACHRDPG